MIRFLEYLADNTIDIGEPPYYFQLKLGITQRRESDRDATRANFSRDNVPNFFDQSPPLDGIIRDHVHQSRRYPIKRDTPIRN